MAKNGLVRRLELAVSGRWRVCLEALSEAVTDRPSHNYAQIFRYIIGASSFGWALGVQFLRPAQVNLEGMWLVLLFGTAHTLGMKCLHNIFAGSFLRGALYVFGFAVDALIGFLAVLVTGGVRSPFFLLCYFCIIDTALYFGTKGAMVATAACVVAYTGFALAGSPSLTGYDLVTLFGIFIPYYFYFGAYAAGAVESEKAQRALRKRSALLYEVSRRTVEAIDSREACLLAVRAAAEYLAPLDTNFVFFGEGSNRVDSADVVQLADEAFRRRDLVLVEKGGVFAMGVPVASGEECLGALVLKLRQKPTEEQIEYLITLANHMGLVLKNQRMLEQLKRLAYTDALTGLANHRRFQERLAEEAERSRRYGSPFSLLLVDIDHFKKFNDTYGHRFGNLALREVAQALRRALRGADFAARYGGEELAVVLPETDLAGACAVAERICREVRRLDLFDPETGTRARVTVSVGAAEFAGDRERLIREADAALYAAKAAGRDTWRVFRREEMKCGTTV